MRLTSQRAANVDQQLKELGVPNDLGRPQFSCGTSESIGRGACNQPKAESAKDRSRVDAPRPQSCGTLEDGLRPMFEAEASGSLRIRVAVLSSSVPGWVNATLLFADANGIKGIRANSV